MAGKRKPKGPDWEAIRAEYLAGAKPRDLAARFSVSPASLESRITRGKWREEREGLAGELREKCREKIVEAASDEAARIVRDHLRILGAASAKAESMLPSVADFQELKDWATAVKTIQSCQRAALGIDKPAPAVPGDESKRPGVVIVPADSDDWASLDG